MTILHRARVVRHVTIMTGRSPVHVPLAMCTAQKMLRVMMRMSAILLTHVQAMLNARTLLDPLSAFVDLAMNMTALSVLIRMNAQHQIFARPLRHVTIMTDHMLVFVLMGTQQATTIAMTKTSAVWALPPAQQDQHAKTQRAPMTAHVRPVIHTMAQLVPMKMNARPIMAGVATHALIPSVVLYVHAQQDPHYSQMA